MACEIERHLTHIDAGVAGLERVKAQLARYRASVLKAACEGRLVPTEAELARCEGRPYEQPHSVLGRIHQGDASPRRHTRAAREALASTAERTILQLPEGWVWTTLGTVAELKGGLTKGQKRAAGVRTRSVPYLRVANVQRGWLDLAQMKSIEATDGEIEELRLRRGDVLFNEGGDRDKLGRGWVWEDQLPLCIHQNHVFRARIREDVLHPKLLSWYGNSIGQNYFQSEGKQTTNLASINLTKLAALPVPIPPLAEQDRIVAEVERRLSIADEVAASVGLGLTRADRLRQAVLKRAFEGKLVRQDPNDEPASVLLERILKERAALAAERPPKRKPGPHRMPRPRKPRKP